MSYNNYFGVEGLEYIPHGEWADPDLVYKGRVFNYWDVFDRLFDEFLEENPEYTDSQAEEMFDQYLRENPSEIESVLYDLMNYTPPQFTVENGTIDICSCSLVDGKVKKGLLDTVYLRYDIYKNITDIFDVVNEYISRYNLTVGDSPDYLYDKEYGTIWVPAYNYDGEVVSKSVVKDYLNSGKDIYYVLLKGHVYNISGQLLEESDLDMVGIENIQDS